MGGLGYFPRGLQAWRPPLPRKLREIKFNAQGGDPQNETFQGGESQVGGLGLFLLDEGGISVI